MYFEELDRTIRQYHLERYVQPCPVCGEPMGIIAFIPPRTVELYCKDVDCPAHYPTYIVIPLEVA